MAEGPGATGGVDDQGAAVGPAPPVLAALTDSVGEAWRILFEQAPVGISIVDRRGRIIIANPAILALTRLADQPAPTMIQDLAHPDDRRLIETEIERVTSGLGGRTALELRLGQAPADGGLDQSQTQAQAVAMVDVTPITEADRTVSGAVVRMTDITRHRLLETQLAQTQKMQAVGQLAGGIAHDFNNLLTTIIAATDLCLARDPVDEPTRGDLVHIRRSAERGAGLVRQLLAFSRKQTLQPKVLRLNDAIEDVASLLRRLLGHRVILELDLEMPGHRVKVDPVQFDQVVVNLALNARDAMPQGGRLAIRTGQLTLYRPLVRGQEVIPPGRYAMIEVADSGTGIEPQHLSRLFEPFFTTKKDSGGTGLGLATVYGIVRQTDGFIAVDSVAGEGTTFRIYLPLQDHAPIAARVPSGTVQTAAQDAAGPLKTIIAGDSRTQASVVAPTVNQRGTLLLAEDEEGVRKLSSRALSAAGWRVLQAGSGEEALEILARTDTPPDLMITDVVMPGIDGPELVRQVRRLLPELPVIVVSGYADTISIEGLGSADLYFLPKPYSLKELISRVEKAVRPG